MPFRQVFKPTAEHSVQAQTGRGRSRGWGRGFPGGCPCCSHRSPSAPAPCPRRSPSRQQIRNRWAVQGPPPWGGRLTGSDLGSPCQDHILKITPKNVLLMLQNCTERSGPQATSGARGAPRLLGLPPRTLPGAVNTEALGTRPTARFKQGYFPTDQGVPVNLSKLGAFARRGQNSGTIHPTLCGRP